MWKIKAIHEKDAYARSPIIGIGVGSLIKDHELTPSQEFKGWLSGDVYWAESPLLEVGVKRSFFKAVKVEEVANGPNT